MTRAAHVAVPAPQRPRDDDLARSSRCRRPARSRCRASASLSALIPDDEIDRLVGRTPSGSTGVRDAYSSGRLPGDLERDRVGHARRQPDHGLAARPRAPPPRSGATLTYDLAQAAALHQLDLQVIADGRHSVPTAMTITSGSQVRNGRAPAHRRRHRARRRHHRAGVLPGAHRARTSSSPSPPSGPSTRPTTTRPGRWPCRSASPRSASPACGRRRRRPTLPGNCVSQPPHHRRPADRRDGRRDRPSRPSTAARCRSSPAGPTPRASRSAPAPHIVADGGGAQPAVRAAPRRPAPAGTSTSSSLDSAAGWRARVRRLPDRAGHAPCCRRPSPGPPRPSPQTSSHIDTHGGDVTGATQPFELVLGQSVNKGWQAVAAARRPARRRARTRSTSARRSLVDGFANGWHDHAPPTCTRSAGPDFTVELTWTPQREVWAALARVRRARCCSASSSASCPSRARRWLRAPPAPPPARAGRARRARAAGRALRRPRPGPAAARRRRRPAPPRLAALPAGAAHRRRHRRRRRARHSAGAPAWPSVAVVVTLGPPRPWARAVATVGGVAFIVAGLHQRRPGPAASTTTCPAPTGPASFVHAGNLIWLGVVLLLADAVDLRPRAAGPQAARSTRHCRAGAVPERVAPPPRPPVGDPHDRRPIDG